MSGWVRQRQKHGRRRARRGFRVALIVTSFVLIAICGAFAAWVHSLGPAPLGEGLPFSTLVVDRDGRLLRPYTTPEGRWRLPATPRRCRPALSRNPARVRGQRFFSHHGVDPLALARAARQLIWNGRIVSGASTLTMQVARLLEPRTERSLGAKLRQIGARHRDRAQAQQGRNPRALSQPRAVWRQSRRHPRGIAGLLRQGAAPPDARRSRAAGGAAAVAGAASPRPLGRSRAQCPQRARPRARSCRRRWRGARRRSRAGQARAGAGWPQADADARAACPPMPRSPPRPAAACIG